MITPPIVAEVGNSMQKGQGDVEEHSIYEILYLSLPHCYVNTGLKNYASHKTLTACSQQNLI